MMLGCVELTESQEVFDLLKGPEVLKRLGEQTNQVKTRDVDNPALEDLDITIVKVSSKREASLVAAMAASNRITASAERRLSHPKSCVEPNSHMVLQVEVCRGSNVKETSKFCIIELGIADLVSISKSPDLLLLHSVGEFEAAQGKQLIPHGLCGGPGILVQLPTHQLELQPFVFKDRIVGARVLSRSSAAVRTCVFPC